MGDFNVFKVRIGEGVLKWVILTGDEKVPIHVAGSEFMRDRAIESLSIWEVKESMELTVAQFMDVARQHPVLIQVESWEPFGIQR